MSIEYKPAIFSFKFKTWLLNNGLYKSKDINADKPTTHTLLSGGNLSVPEFKMNEFLKKMSEILVQKENKETIFINELKTDIFRFFIDLDYKDEIELTLEETFEIVKVIQLVIKEFLPKCNVKVIISNVEKKEVLTDNNELVIKSGIHLHFPEIFTNKEYALILRSACIQKLERMYPIRPLYSTWENIIDIAVYKGAGLRMIGNNKSEQCPSCKSKSMLRDQCITCDRTGKIDTGRPYKFLNILDNNGDEMIIEKNELIDNCFLLLQQTTIRTILSSPNFNLNQTKFPEWYSHQVYDSHLREKKIVTKKKGKGNHKYIIDIIETRYHKIEIQETDKIFIKLEELLPIMLQKEFLFKKIYKIYRCISKSEKNKKMFYLIQTNCSYCLNVKRTHTSNHSFLYMDCNSIYQKCHSETKNYNGIVCKNFKGKIRDLSPEIKFIFFPEKKEKFLSSLNKISTSSSISNEIENQTSQEILPIFSTIDESIFDDSD